MIKAKQYDPGPEVANIRSPILTNEASRRIGHADVAFTGKQYVQTDLEADRRVATTLAELIIGGSLASTEVTYQARRHEAGPRLQIRLQTTCQRPSSCSKEDLWPW